MEHDGRKGKLAPHKRCWSGMCFCQRKPIWKCFETYKLMVAESKPGSSLEFRGVRATTQVGRCTGAAFWEAGAVLPEKEVAEE